MDHRALVDETDPGPIPTVEWRPTDRTTDPFNAFVRRFDAPPAGRGLLPREHSTVALNG